MIPGSANPLLLRSAAAGGYSIQRSIRLNAPDSAYLSRTPASAGNRKTWTWAGWVKPTKLGTYRGILEGYTGTPAFANRTSIQFANSDQIDVLFDNTSSGRITTTAVFRDPSAWYHLVFACDTTQATASNRFKLYVNGSQVTVFSTASYPAQNYDTGINTTQPHYMGRVVDPLYADYYLADLHFCDGTAYDASAFGEFDDNGIWQPKAFAGSYGTQGWHLDFADNSSNTATTLGKDTSPNGNNWTPNNLSVTAGAGNDSLVDVPTNGGQTDTGAGGEVRGNYCTLNPLDKGNVMSLSDGNLYCTSSAAAHNLARGTIGVSTGKWYWEVTATAPNNDNIGVANRTIAVNGQVLANPGDANSSGIYVANFSTGSVLGFALDLDSGKLFIAENGAWKNSGNPVTGANPWSSSLTSASGPYFPAANLYNFNGVPAYTWNFGQRPFAYTAPSGFKALNTANLPAPLVTKPSTVMDAVTYTGNGSAQTITLPGGFSPDLIWVKQRTSAASHVLVDSVRGAFKLSPNQTIAEIAGGAFYGSVSPTSSGFSLVQGSDTDPNFGGFWEVGANAKAYAGWCWDAGSSTVTNTQGSISSQVRANASAGFSVVTYTGTGANATVGHGLGVAPGMVIVKRRNSTSNWQVRHTSIAAANSIQLNLSNAAASATTVWNSTVPSSTVFSIGTDATVNASGGTFVAYCFAPVVGYSSFGSYTGNGSADGPFVYTGFRPRWVMLKYSSGADGHWVIYDALRGSFNLNSKKLAANLSEAENDSSKLGDDSLGIDFLSNGFKIRTTGLNHNISSGTYVWAAFAEHPFQYARAR